MKYRDHVKYCLLEAEKTIDAHEKSLWLKMAREWAQLAEKHPDLAGALKPGAPPPGATRH